MRKREGVEKERREKKVEKGTNHTWSCRLRGRRLDLTARTMEVIDSFKQASGVT